MFCHCRFLGAILSLAGTSSALFGQMLYIGNSRDGTISSYVIDQESGLLTELLPRVGSRGAPLSVAVHPNGKFVYASNGGSAALGAGPSLAWLSIDAGTGALKLLDSVPLTAGGNPSAVAIDPFGKFGFVAQQGANNVAVFSIDASSGAASPVAGSPFATPQNPSSVVVHPNGKFAYVSAAGAGQIAAFGIGADGALTPLDGSPYAARNNMPWMAMDKAGKFLFAAERQDSGVLVYAVNDTTGALTPVSGSPFPAPAGSGPTGVAVDPAGKFLYVSVAGLGGVLRYNIDATGALSQGRTFGAIISANAAIPDPSGKFLYVPGPQANAVAGLAIDATNGNLTPLPQQFYPAGDLPQRGATVLLSPPILPPISAGAAFNQFSARLAGMSNAGIAQGSRLAISGNNIGPAVAVDAPSTSDPVLHTELGGVSVQIQSGDVTTAALMIHASNRLVAALVPSTTPLGDATVTLTYRGRTTAPLPITIVTTAVGIRTLNGQGSGPAKAWNAPPDTVMPSEPALQTPNTLNQPAKPGKLMVVHATGLGPANFDETQESMLELDIPADVIVGNKVTTAIAKVRVLGTDYILFKLPDDTLEGCYVPIAIRAGGVTANVASISIAASDGSCSDPAGLAASDIEAARQAGQLNIASIALDHLDLGLLGVVSEAQGLFGRYGFNSLLGALAPGLPELGIRQSFTAPPPGTCTVTPGAPTRSDVFDLPGDPAPVQFLNAGQRLNLNGPQGTVQLLAPDYYFSSDDNVITPGDYTVDNGAGTPAIGPFKATITLPPMVKWTNRDSLGTVDRTQDLTVTWTGGVAGKELAVIVGLSANRQAAGGFLCTEKITAGKFTVPAWVLSSLPNSDTFPMEDISLPGGLVGVGAIPLTSAGRFTAAGLDVGIFTYEQATIGFTMFQ